MAEQLPTGNNERTISNSSSWHGNTYNDGNRHPAPMHTNYTGYGSSPIIEGPDAFIWIPTTLLESCHAYALERGNGIYTRLIPADQLPRLQGVPQTQGPDGLIILPPPGPPSRMGAVPDTHHIPRSPVIASDHFLSNPAGQDHNQVSSTIDNNGAPKQDRVAQIPKVKVYCSKWVHSGTCAFTQRGCLYKHEMPMDRATQMEVGLFNGLPQWYKRYQQRGGTETQQKAREENNSRRGGRGGSGDRGQNISQRPSGGSQQSTLGPLPRLPRSSSGSPMAFAAASPVAPAAIQHATCNISTRYIKNGTVTQQGSLRDQTANPYKALSDFLEGDE